MCDVRLTNMAERRITVDLKKNRTLTSDWFMDEKCLPVEGSVNVTRKEKEVYDELLAKNGISEKDVLGWYLSIKREEDNVRISEHAALRMRQRQGWNKKTAVRMVKRIYNEGQRPNEVKGYLRNWVLKKSSEGGRESECILYGDYLYIFRSQTLISVIHAPSKHRAESYYDHKYGKPERGEAC